MTFPDPAALSATATTTALRHQLVDLICSRTPLPPDVEAAMRAVPRHEFLPAVSVETAYSNETVTIKDNPGGPLACSCASLPALVARMLVQLDLRPGDNVLEIGAGTGYNAALLSWLAGPRGSVTTVDIDRDVVAHARGALGRFAALDGAAGRDGRGPVTVLHGDGLLGAPERGPFDRIIATVGMWDLPDPWRFQLAEGGRMVVPLRWRGLTRLLTLTRQGNALVAQDLYLCGFVPVIGQDGEHTTSLLGDTVRLHHDGDQPVTADRLRNAFSAEPAERWSSTTATPEEDLSGIWLRASAARDTVCHIEVTDAAQELGVRRPQPPRSPVLVNDGSLAYSIARPEPHNGSGARRARLGAIGYGPDAAAMARALVEITDAWGADRQAVPDLRIYPSLIDVDPPPGARVIPKNDSQLVISYLPRS